MADLPTEVEPAAGAALDLHEGISTPPPGGCPRWPEHLRLRASSGELVRGRCRSTNQCSYCARLAAVENSEVLALDAMRSTPPAAWAVLTTRSADPDPARFYGSRRKLHQAIRRRWPGCEYAALVEFTTGYGRRSGGRRRPHWNLLLKGVPATDLERLHDVVARVWCARVDASPRGQFVGSISEAGGLMRYLALHFQKQSQSPPAGWRGHRFMHSRGYFDGGIAQLRSEAREQLQYRREVWKLERIAEQEGVRFDGQELDEWARRSLEVRAALSWELVRIFKTGGDRLPHSARRPLRAAHLRGGRPEGTAAP